jgi:hypothetical protein
MLASSLYRGKKAEIYGIIILDPLQLCLPRSAWEIVFTGQAVSVRAELLF